MQERRLEDVLREKFGHDSFRPGQRRAVLAVLGGRDALVVMPTGGGKSLCYQLPALILEGTTLVVSPLLALMKDQVDALTRRGVAGVSAISSADPPSVRARVLADLAAGRSRIVYVSPERFASDEFLSALEGLRIPIFAVDEAHCVATWGHDFRPEYLRLGEAIRRLAPRSTLALTATATPRVRREIAERLGLTRPEIEVGSFDRPNLHLGVTAAPREAKIAILGQGLERPGALPALVYVARQKDAERISAELAKRGHSSAFYHAGLAGGLRRETQERFLSGDISVLVATVAFGMGIDKPDVRSVFHWQSPASIENYFQEAGRAGRDGSAARCEILHDDKDLGLHRWFLCQRYPVKEDVRRVRDRLATGMPSSQARALESGWSNERWNLVLGALGCPDRLRAIDDAWSRLVSLRRTEWDRLNAMEAYLASARCRREDLLGYFGERSEEPCGRCDACERAATLPRGQGNLTQKRPAG